jgi:hypothetical protein
LSCSCLRCKLFCQTLSCWQELLLAPLTRKGVSTGIGCGQG